MPNYTKKQLWELYNALPKELQEAASSQEVGRNVQEICSKNGMTSEDTIFEVIKNTGYVFLGLLPPDELSFILERELKLKKEVAELISSEIIRFAFLPVKSSLEALYGIKIKPSVKPGVHISAPAEDTAPAPKKPKKKDVYLEPLE